jgi:ABC-type branched-subunit amino acid transport system substrate-binding protein
VSRSLPRLLAAGAVLSLAAAACGSSSSGGAAAAGSTSGKTTVTITVGLLYDATGPGASVNKFAVGGLKAGVVAAARQGVKIKYVLGDTGTNPSTVLPVAQRLVAQQHVSAVIAISNLALIAAPYFTRQNIPVVGLSGDGNEWTTSKNMFATTGPLNLTKVATTLGKFMKSQGVTSLGALGYEGIPSSVENAKASAESATTAGLKVGYLNAALPFGTVDMQPTAIAMKAAGIDGLATAVNPNTSFALITALRNLGVNLKVALPASGYGDLAQAGTETINEAQGLYFSSLYEPMEDNTAATRQFQSDLSAASVTDSADLAVYSGYVSALLVADAVQKAGGKTTPADLQTALSGIHDFDGGGLFGGKTVDINNRTDTVLGPNNCLWILKVSGAKFQPVPAANPICGDVIPNKTVTP